MMNKPLAIAYKPFKAMNMKANTSKERSFYTQGQRFAARILFILWLLASGSPEGALATPKRQPTMTPALTTSPQGSSLASTPPTPYSASVFHLCIAPPHPSAPGGILQLPPDSPGAFWGDSVASSPSIDAALQRQRPSSLLPRTIDKLVGRFWSHRPQEAPRTPAGPVAEGVTEGSSTATPSTLEQLMSREGVPDNDTLVAALNAAPTQEQRQWISAAIQWFATQPIETLSPAAIRDYAALAHVQATRENSELLRRYLHSLCNKVKDGSFGEKPLIQALAYALAHIERNVFSEDPQPLIALGQNLLTKLDPSQREFKQADYPSARASLEALSQTLFLVHEVAPGHLNVKDGSLYQKFREKLQAIADGSQYYPVCYQARLLKQTLRLLGDSNPDLESKLRRIGQGLLGAANLVAVGQGLATGELKPAEFQAGVAFLKKAAHGQCIRPKPWYESLLILEEKMLQCLEDQDLKAYPQPEELMKLVQAINSSNLKDRAVNKAPQYRQTLRFGIVMQLQTLALRGPTHEVRQEMIRRLIDLGQPKYWESDSEVMIGLLDSLALVAVQIQVDQDRGAEVVMAHKALEALKTGARATQWLSGEELDTKLNRFREPVNQYVPSCEDRLFSQIRAMRQPASVLLARQIQEGIDETLKPIQKENQAQARQLRSMLSKVRDMFKNSLTPQQFHEGLDKVLQEVKLPKDTTPPAVIVQYFERAEHMLSKLKDDIQPSEPSITTQQFQAGIEKILQVIQGRQTVPTVPALFRQSSLDQLREQIDAGKRPEELYPLIQERLADPQKTFECSEQIALLTDCMRYGQVNAEKILGKDAVIVLGNTGAGKSTFINYLAGCQLEEKCDEDYDEDHESVLVVKNRASGGTRDEVMPIGHDGASKTFMPHIVEIDSWTYCDCPGFSDNRGAEINIANAVNIKQALSRATSIRIVVLVNYQSLKVDRGNSFRGLLRTFTDLLGSEAAIVEHKGSILLGISKGPRSNLTPEKLWQRIEKSVPVPESLKCLKKCVFQFNPLNPKSEWSPSDCLAALARLKKLENPSSILSVSLNADDLNALNALVNKMGEEISEALAQGNFKVALARFRSLERLSVIKHKQIEQLLSNTQDRISVWLKDQEAKFRFRYAVNDFDEAEHLLSSLHEAVTSLNSSDLDIQSLRAELENARKNHQKNQEKIAALESQLSSLLETVKKNADSAATNYEKVYATMLELFKQQHENIVTQLASQEEAFQRRMEFLEAQINAQKESYELSRVQLNNDYTSDLKNQEIKVQQEGLSAEEQKQALSALKEELEANYQSELQAQEAQHKQEIARLEKEKSAAESALHEENKKLLADQKMLLSEHESAYEELLGVLQKKDEELSKLREELQRLKSAKPREDIAKLSLVSYYSGAESPYVKSLFEEHRSRHVQDLECQLMLLEQKLVKQDKAKEERGDRSDHIAQHHERRFEWVKTPLGSEDLFKKRSIKPGDPEKEIQRILLTGDPGTGKTTLSKQLAYQWSQGQWGQEFAALYLLPVRSLHESMYDGTRYNRENTLATAIVNTCFAHDFPATEDEYNSLRAHIDQELEKPMTLVILDGLDDRAGASEKILRQAQAGTHKLLMLSRPYGIDAERRLSDLEIEHVGFNRAQLKAYVQAEVPDGERASELLGYIDKHENIRAIAHVPVNLQILCALWQDEDSGVDREELQQGSFFGLYRLITDFTWQRYKERAKEDVSPQAREDLFDKLGQIALGALEDGEVLIRPGRINKTLSNSATDVDEIKQKCQDVGFLLLQYVGDDTDKQQGFYEFPHLTFQEYFAGRALAHQFLSENKREQKRASTFLSEHKYESQYGRTLTFMAGEVSRSEEIEDIRKLLSLLGEEKEQEIVGVQHLLLQLRVFHEWLCMAGEAAEDELAELEERFHMLASLEEWFVRAFVHVRLEGYDTDRPGRDLLGLLKSSLQTFGSIARHAPELLELFKKTAQGPHGAVRLAAVSSLGGALAGAHDEVRAMLQAMVDDRHESDYIKQAARQSLSQATGAESTQDETAVGGGAAQGSLGEARESASQSPGALFEQLRQAAKDAEREDDKALRSSRGSLVQAVAAATQEEFGALLDLLLPAAKDRNGWVREAAQEALWKAPLEELLEHYWSRPDTKLIPYITPRLYHTPLVIAKSVRSGPQRVSLYAAAGQAREWRQPQVVVEDFKRHVQDAVSQLSQVESRLSVRVDKSVWEHYFGAVGEEPELPDDLEAILDSPCPFWEGRQVRDTHMLVLIPSHVGGQPLTLDYLGELIKSPQEGYGTKYREYWYEVRQAIGSQSPGSSYWVLMTKDVLPESRTKRYEDQRKLVADHANRTGLGYKVPGTLEAAVVTLLHHVRSGERLYSNSPNTYTRCQESVGNRQLVVGGFSSGGLSIHFSISYGIDDVGVAGLRKF